jgi:hypothetical protein
VLNGEHEWEDVSERRAFTNALEDAIAYILRQRGEFGVAPAFPKDTYERVSCTSLEVVVRDVVELEEHVIETVEHLVHNAGLGLVVEMHEREIVCGAQDGKHGVGVVCAMRV